MRHLIGVILLCLVVFQYMRSRRASPPGSDVPPPAPWLAPLAGITAGFTTMVANAAGPVRFPAGVALHGSPRSRLFSF